jgi:hypothetical protein
MFFEDLEILDRQQRRHFLPLLLACDGIRLHESCLRPCGAIGRSGTIPTLSGKLIFIFALEFLDGKESNGGNNVRAAGQSNRNLENVRSSPVQNVLRVIVQYKANRSSHQCDGCCDDPNDRE